MKEKYKLIIPVIRTMKLYEKDGSNNRVKEIIKENDELRRSLSELSNDKNKDKYFDRAIFGGLGFIGGKLIGNN